MGGTMSQDLKERPGAPASEEPEGQTFVEVALELGGKSAEESRKTGKLDRADEQVEAMFATRYQTSNSPIHRAVWDRTLPLDLFQSRPPDVPESCRRVMDESLDVVRRHVAGGTLYDENRKIAKVVLEDLA